MIQNIWKDHKTQTQYHLVLHVHVYSMSLLYTSVIRSDWLPYKSNYTAFTGTLQNYVYFDSFPYVPKILDLNFMQTGHLILKFYIATLRGSFKKFPDCFHYLNVSCWIHIEIICGER